MQNVVTVLGELLPAYHDSHHGCCHEHTAQQGRDSGSEKSQFGESCHTIDEQPVAEDVDHVACYHHPHRHTRLCHAIKKLLHGVEYAHEEYRDEVDDEVGTDEVEQLFGLSDVREVEVEHHKRYGEKGARKHIGKERVAHLLSDAVDTFLAIEPADDRSQTIGEAHIHDEHQGIDVVDKSCRSQFFRAVVTYHDGVGKT